MTKITTTETPEDFALHLLDQLMEKEGDKLSTFQVLQAAQAYATAGMAQATREANGNLDTMNVEQDRSIDRLISENEGRARRLNGELPVMEFVPNSGIPSEDYTLMSDGVNTYWVHKRATEEEIDSGVALIRFFSDTEDIDKVEGKLEHVDVSTGEVSKMEMDAAYEEFKKDREEGKPLSSVTVFKEDIYEKEPTKVLPQSLREKIEAEIAKRALPDTEEVLGTLSVVTPEEGTDIIADLTAAGKTGESNG